MNEQALDFECAGCRLHGVLAVPDRPPETAVLIVVGGPQYRVGSHRQFVHLARGLALHGVATLRFDVRGMGDSEGMPQGFEHQSDDIAHAIAALRQALPSVRRVGGFGLCDGASSLLLHLDADARHRFDALVLLNPWVRRDDTQARTQVKHYYGQRLRDPAFWRKLFSGKVALSAVAEVARAVRKAIGRSPAAGDGPALHYTARMARAWKRCRSPILLLLSAEDYTAREFDEALRTDTAWQGAASQAGVTRVDLANADHTLSKAGAKDAALATVVEWLRSQGLAPHHG